MNARVSHRKKRGMTRRWLRIKAECHNGSFLRGAQRLTAVSLAWLLLVGVAAAQAPVPAAARIRCGLAVSALRLPWAHARDCHSKAVSQSAALALRHAPKPGVRITR